MSKTQTEEKSSTKVSKENLAKLAAKSGGKQKADKATSDAVAKKITEKKDLKYIYPDDCTDLTARKRFRHKTRQGLKRLKKALKTATKANDEAAIKLATKELHSFEKERCAAVPVKA